MANGGELNGVRVLSEAGTVEAVQNPVVAADRVGGAEGAMQPFMMCDTSFVQGGWNCHTHPREPKGLPPGPVSTVHGTAGYGWGGLGGSNLWFNPVENIGFGYSCTGASEGFT